MKKYFLIVLGIFVLAIAGRLIAEQGDFATLGYNSSDSISYWRVDSDGHFKPGIASTYNLGTSALPIGTVYADAIIGASVSSGGAFSGTSGTFSEALTGQSVKVSSGPMTLYSRSSAQILALTPAEVGEMYFCNNCSPLTLCVSTGTAVLQFADVADPTAACD